MEFFDDGVILSARAHGEAHAVVDALTAEHGRWAGLVYGGQGRKQQPVLQPGNGVRLSWKGRLADSLGHFTLDLTEPRAAALLSDRLALAGLSAVAAVAAATLPEREKHPGLYEAMLVVLDNLGDPDLWPTLLARWELHLLAALGFGLDLEKCAATGATENLTYLSPKTGRAVSAEAGAPYKDKLLPLPAFLRGDGGAPDPRDPIDALYATGYFIETRILHPASRELPEARRRVVDMIKSRIGD